MFLHKLDVERNKKGDGSKTLLAKQTGHSLINSFKAKHANFNVKSYTDAKRSLIYKEPIF